MSNKSLKTLSKLAETQAQASKLQYIKKNQLVKTHQQRLQELNSYFQEYRQLPINLSAPPTTFLNHLAFSQRIQEASQQQSANTQIAQKDAETVCTQWLNAKRYAAAIENIRLKRNANEKNKEQKKLQRELDDLATFKQYSNLKDEE